MRQYKVKDQDGSSDRSNENANQPHNQNNLQNANLDDVELNRDDEVFRDQLMREGGLENRRDHGERNIVDDQHLLRGWGLSLEAEARDLPKRIHICGNSLKMAGQRRDRTTEEAAVRRRVRPSWMSFLDFYHSHMQA